MDEPHAPAGPAPPGGQFSPADAPSPPGDPQAGDPPPEATDSRAPVLPHVVADARPSPAAGMQRAASRVEQIVAAAEHAAEELRASAERRALERIAEADRAAAIRVRAADHEAEQVRRDVGQEAEQTRAAAAESGREAREKAQASAREIVAQARAAAREVLRDGEELSGNLREMSSALLLNAELLLRDIRQAHAQFTARLDRVDPGPAPRGPTSRSASAADTLDVPEFVPRG